MAHFLAILSPKMTHFWAILAQKFQKFSFLKIFGPKFSPFLKMAKKSTPFGRRTRAGSRKFRGPKVPESEFSGSGKILTQNFQILKKFWPEFSIFPILLHAPTAPSTTKDVYNTPFSLLKIGGLELKWRPVAPSAGWPLPTILVDFLKIPKIGATGRHFNQLAHTLAKLYKLSRVQRQFAPHIKTLPDSAIFGIFGTPKSEL